MGKRKNSLSFNLSVSDGISLHISLAIISGHYFISAEGENMKQALLLFHILPHQVDILYRSRGHFRILVESVENKTAGGTVLMSCLIYIITIIIAPDKTK